MDCLTNGDGDSRGAWLRTFAKARAETLAREKGKVKPRQPSGFRPPRRENIEELLRDAKNK